jgi:hypothetical protein
MKTKKIRWTKKEKDFLTNNYNTMLLKDMIKLSLFKNRNYNTLQWMSNVLGLYSKGNKGELSRAWRGGKYITTDGRIMLNKNGANCPYGDKREMVFEHVFVWWQHYPKNIIKSDEIIHHKDFNKLNNKITNLIKMKKIDHDKLHTNSRARCIKCMRFINKNRQHICHSGKDDGEDKNELNSKGGINGICKD